MFLSLPTDLFPGVGFPWPGAFRGQLCSSGPLRSLFPPQPVLLDAHTGNRFPCLNPVLYVHYCVYNDNYLFYSYFFCGGSKTQYFFFFHYVFCPKEANAAVFHHLVFVQSPKAHQWFHCQTTWPSVAL